MWFHLHVYTCAFKIHYISKLSSWYHLVIFIGPPLYHLISHTQKRSNNLDFSRHRHLLDPSSSLKEIQHMSVEKSIFMYFVSFDFSLRVFYRKTCVRSHGLCHLIFDNSSLDRDRFLYIVLKLPLSYLHQSHPSQFPDIWGWFLEISDINLLFASSEIIK